MKKLYVLLVGLLLMGLVSAEGKILIKHNTPSTQYIDSLHFLEYDNEHNPIVNASCIASTYNGLTNAVIQVDMPSKKLQSSSLNNDYYNTLAYSLYDDGKYFIEINCLYDGLTDKNTFEFQIQTKNELDNSLTISDSNPISMNNVKDLLAFAGIKVPPQVEEFVNGIIGMALSIGEEDIMPIIISANILNLLFAIAILPMTLFGSILGIVAIPAGIITFAGTLLFPVFMVFYELYAVIMSFSQYNGLEKIKSFVYYQILPAVIFWNLFCTVVILAKDTLLFIYDTINFVIGKIPVVNYIFRGAS
jgi:hypothetical protein